MKRSRFREILKEEINYHQKIFPGIKITDYFLHESKNIIQEIQLDPKNGYPIEGNDFEGKFKTPDMGYTYHVDEVESPLYLPDNIELEGKIYNIYFRRTEDEQYDHKSYEKKKGKDNLIKIYNTLFNIYKIIAEKYKPDYILIYALEAAYFPIYVELAKKNKIPGYLVKTTSKFELEDEMKQVIVLKKR